MQKLLTVMINTEKLKDASRGPFTITDVEGINSLLREGWAIQEWEFLTTSKEDGTAVLMLMLNDELAEMEFGVHSYSSNELGGEEDEELEEAGEEEIREIDPEELTEAEDIREEEAAEAITIR